jgi:hypothetical protein
MFGKRWRLRSREARVADVHASGDQLPALLLGSHDLNACDAH